MIIEISQRLQHLKLRAQYVCNTLLGGRLTRRTSDGNQLLTPEPPRRSTQMLQRQRAVRNGHQARVGGKARELIACDYGSHRARLQSGFHVVMAVNPLSFDGKEKIARMQRARVNRVAFGNRSVIEAAACLDEFRDPA